MIPKKTVGKIRKYNSGIIPNISGILFAFHWFQSQVSPKRAQKNKQNGDQV